ETHLHTGKSFIKLDAPIDEPALPAQNLRPTPLAAPSKARLGPFIFPKPIPDVFLYKRGGPFNFSEYDFGPSTSTAQPSKPTSTFIDDGKLGTWRHPRPLYARRPLAQSYHFREHHIPKPVYAQGYYERFRTAYPTYTAPFGQFVVACAYVLFLLEIKFAGPAEHIDDWVLRYQKFQSEKRGISYEQWRFNELRGTEATWAPTKVLRREDLEDVMRGKEDGVDGVRESMEAALMRHSGKKAGGNIKE
ncbi:hypothetical protein LTS18_005250, partial [Coniosporium uncinatum]